MIDVVCFDGEKTMEQFTAWSLASRAEGFILEVLQYYYPRRGHLEVTYEYWMADRNVVDLTLLARSPANE